MTCPQITGSPTEAERALWQCADSAVQMAEGALILCFLLMGFSALLIFWLYIIAFYASP